jgi:hypothetical protein
MLREDDDELIFFFKRFLKIVLHLVFVSHKENKKILEYRLVSKNRALRAELQNCLNLITFLINKPISTQ